LPLCEAWIEISARIRSSHSTSRRPFAGARIETRSTMRYMPTKCRSPLCGAWIETRCQQQPTASRDHVAPLTGADRNHKKPVEYSKHDTSLLDGSVDRNGGGRYGSAGIRTVAPRGVDQNFLGDRIDPVGLVAPSGVWIETRQTYANKTSSVRLVAPSRGVDRNIKAETIRPSLRGSPLHGGVDRNHEYDHSTGTSWAVAPSRGRGSKR
jgi:hypothetical protein